MKRFTPVGFALAALVAACPVSAWATDLQLTIKDGRVTLIADNVSARQILEEWAAVGDATIVNADKLSGPPLTVRLENVAEREALDIVLRSAAGYVAAPRPAGDEGASRFDRIVVLAESQAPRNSARSMSPPAPAPFAPPPVTADDQYEPDPPEPVETGTVPQQLQPYPGPFPGTVPQPQEEAPAQPQTSPRPGFIPAPAQPKGPVTTMPPGYPGAPPAPPRKPGGGGGR